MSGRALIVRGDARALPLPDASVDLVVTSPPYYALRSYTDGGEHYDGQIGSESTPAAYVEALLDCTREMVRVLKPSGSLWVNLGDKYDSSSHAMNGVTASAVWHGGNHDNRATRRPVFGRPKSLLGLPWRYALACVDRLGLILRAEVIWSKPNGLPESVTDRVRRSHEQWFHLVKQPRYYSAVDEIRESLSSASPEHDSRRRARTDARMELAHSGRTSTSNPLGKLPGSVWTIPTEPLSVPAHLGVDHYAAFPTEWPRRIILGWSPSGICTVCGEGRRPVAYVSNHMQRTHKPQRVGLADRHSSDGREGDRKVQTAVIVGQACTCPKPTAPIRPAVILDPFGGTGTTALVAHTLGRIGISVDRSADYSRLAAWRTTNPGAVAKAMRVAKPEPVADTQLTLDFGDVA